MHVNFDFQFDPSGNPRPEQRFAITQLIEYRLGGLDFAVVRLAGNPGATFGTSGMSSTDAAIGDMACIIGHPLGMPKRIEAGPVTELTGTRILYNDIDTLGGNSGSGILRANDGKIVGVHTDGGCNRAGTGSNSGVRISSIIEQSHTVRSLIQPCPGPTSAIFYRGEGDWLAWRACGEGRWQGEERFNDRHPNPTPMPSAPAVVSNWRGHRFAVFFRGEGDRLHWKAHHGGRWHRHAPLEGGGIMTSDPAVVRIGDNELAVFYRGEGGWLAWRAFSGDRWHGEERFDERHPVPTLMRGSVVDPLRRPAVLSNWGNHRFAVFFRGEDNRLHWKAHHGGRWHRHARLEGGGIMTSDPAIVTFQP